MGPLYIALVILAGRACSSLGDGATEAALRGFAEGAPSSKTTAIVKCTTSVIPTPRRRAAGFTCATYDTCR